MRCWQPLWQNHCGALLAEKLWWLTHNGTVWHIQANFYDPLSSCVLQWSHVTFYSGPLWHVETPWQLPLFMWQLSRHNIILNTSIMSDDCVITMCQCSVDCPGDDSLHSPRQTAPPLPAPFIPPNKQQQKKSGCWQFQTSTGGRNTLLRFSGRHSAFLGFTL